MTTEEKNAIRSLRDYYVLCKGLAYAITIIEQLPPRWQEWSDKEDMKVILDRLAGDFLGSGHFYQAAQHHLLGAGLVEKLTVDTLENVIPISTKKDKKK